MCALVALGGQMLLEAFGLIDVKQLEVAMPRVRLEAIERLGDLINRPSLMPRASRRRFE